MDLSNHYRNLLTGPGQDPGLESTGAGGPDLSNAAIAERERTARAELHQIVRDHLGDAADLHAIADRIAAQGGQALRLLRDGDPRLEQGDFLSGLEAIIRTDGSRPSFLIRDGDVDRSTSPLGDWGPTLDASAPHLARAIACVGRIDLPGAPPGYQGTGFLIQENLIVTNRHVLQVIADPGDDGAWTFRPGASIDFGHEFRGRGSVTPRALKRLVFTGPKAIKFSGGVDHTKLDIALIEIEPAPSPPPAVLAVDGAVDWASPDLIVFTIGYPANPGLDYTPTLLELLFQATYGCKRLAPGRIMPSQITTQAWTTAHDATTLGGNSGSVVLVAGREEIAAGLHYGGRKGEPRENWGHILGAVLDQPGAPATPTTLREQFEQYGVKLIDRRGGGHDN
jgi:Trypsin-like peptidase domain